MLGILHFSHAGDVQNLYSALRCLKIIGYSSSKEAPLPDRVSGTGMDEELRCGPCSTSYESPKLRKRTDFKCAQVIGRERSSVIDIVPSRPASRASEM